MGINSR